MKKIVKFIMMFISLFALFGCNDHFLYYKNKAMNIENYKYYTLTQTISNDKLLLYEKKIKVYLNNDSQKIEIAEKEINGYEDKQMYSTKEEEYYIDGTTLYFKDNDLWKVKNIEVHNYVGLKLKKEYFKSYEIVEKEGKNVFKGKIKKDKINEFMSFDIKDAKDVCAYIEINEKGIVLLIEISYTSSANNNVTISLKPNYSYVLDFHLPVIE